MAGLGAEPGGETAFHRGTCQQYRVDPSARCENGENSAFGCLGPLSNAKRPLYQDKLGANIGEVEKQGVCAGIEGSADDAARFCDFVHEAAAHGIEIELFNNGETLASSRSAWDLIDLAFARNCSGSAGAGTAASVRQAE